MSSPPQARSPFVRPLHDWLLVTHLLVFVLPVAVLLGTGAWAVDLRRQTLDDIAHQAVIVSLHCEAMADAGVPLQAQSAGLSRLLQTAKQRTLAGYRVVDTAGIVQAASNGVTGTDISQDNLLQAVLNNRTRQTWSEARDTSRSLSMPLSGPSRRASVRMFVAEPIFVGPDLVGAVVVSRTPREELQALWHMAPRLTTGALLALAFTVGLALTAGRVLSRSLRSLATASHRMATGHLDALHELAPAQRSRVAEARELAGAMGSMATRLAARLRYIGEFASHVSHEFKTPVSALRGTVELILDDDEMPRSVRERFLQNAIDDLDRLSRLVSGLLRLARAEEGGGRSVVSLDAVVDDVLARYPAVERKGTTGLLDAQASQVGSAVANLVENAQRYGGEHATVTVETGATQDTVWVSVVDDGPGISEANQAQVFERFFTTGRERGGTGLGLALVQAVVEAHGGKVSLDSRPGHTAFLLRFPRAG